MFQVEFVYFRESLSVSNLGYLANQSCVGRALESSLASVRGKEVQESNSVCLHSIGL